MPNESLVAPEVSEQDRISLEAMRTVGQTPRPSVALPEILPGEKPQAPGTEPTLDEIKEFHRIDGSVNPLIDLSATDLAAFIESDAKNSPNNYNLESELLKLRPQWNDELFGKAAETWRLLNVKGGKIPSDLGISQLPGMAVDVAKGAAKFAAKAATGPIAGSPFDMLFKGRFGQTPTDADLLEGQQATGEAVAGAIAGAKHTLGIPIAIAERLTRKSPKDWTPEESVAELSKALSARVEEENILKGGGDVPVKFSPEVREEMAKGGFPIRPEESAAVMAGDPTSFILFGKGMEAIGAVIGPTLSGGARLAGKIPGVATALKTASKAVERLPEKVVGKTAELGGAAVRGTAGLVERAAPVAVPLIGAVSGGGALTALGHAAAGALGGMGLAVPAVRPIVAVARGIGRLGEGIRLAGRELRTGDLATRNITQGVRDVLQSIPGAADSIGHGAVLDLGLAAVTSTTPEDQQGLQLGTILGAAQAGRKTAGWVVSGQRIAARPWGSATPIASSRQLPVFDAMHTAAYQKATPAVRERVNAVRQFVKGIGSDADVFLADPTHTRVAADGRPVNTDIETALLNSGYEPAYAELAGKQNGFFEARLLIPGRPGETHRAIVLGDADAAPHEAKHAFQDVVGEQANQAIDAVIRQAYDSQWEALGQNYTELLLGRKLNAGESWRDSLLEVTDGNNAALVKLGMERGEATPYQLTPGQWREVLTPEEAAAAADKYIAREIAAENFDAIFKNLGGSLKERSGVLPWLAKVVASTTEMLGGDSLQGRESTIGIPLKAPVISAIKKQVRGVIPAEAVEPKTTTPRAIASPPGTPQDEARVTEEISRTASVDPTGPETDAQSPREILGVFAEAKAAGQGVKISRRSAPGTPAGAIEISRRGRRQQIETARSIPDDQKPLWEKNFTPVKTVQLKDGSLQEQGWSPEVLAANAEKLAGFLSKTDPSKSPFAIDVVKGSFTPEGWKDLFDKVNIFAQNQAAGLTGRGTPLELGKARDFGFFEPAGNRVAAGTLTDAEANFINYLFGFPLPGEGKPTVARGGKQQFGVQLISQATEPGRAQPLVEPRTFQSKQAVELGFAGEPVLEVNPLRAEIEALAKAKGTKAPSPIEVWQNLNLRDIVKAEAAPELPAVRPVGVTLRAGFQPMPRNPRAIKEAAVRDENGKIYTGRWHAEAIEKAEAARAKPMDEDGLFIGEDGFVTNSGEFLDRQEASKRAVELNQISKEDAHLIGAEAGYEPNEIQGLESGLFDTRRQFQPMPRNPRAIKEAAVRDENGKIYTGRWHAEAIEKAEAARAKPMDEDGLFIGEDGFVTNSGEFLNRDESQARALEIGQLEKKPKYGGLESFEFKANRQFQPMPRNPRAVRSAAVRDESGKIFEGSWHGEAFMKAQEAPGERGTLEEGFVANNDDWYSREKAAAVAEEIGQLPAQADRGLQSETFESQRAFQPATPRKEIELIGPDGKKYKALFDGYQDATVLGLGHVPQITPLEDLPGSVGAKSTTYGPSLEKAGYKLPELPEAQFQPKPRVGTEFQKFFSDVTKGTFGKSDVPFQPIQDLSAQAAAIESRAKHSGNFDDHIAKSIPTFYETQVRKANALANALPEGSRVLDIAASEGSFGKSISELSGGKVQTVSLDPNPDMAAFFESKSSVPGAEYSTDAFLNGFEGHPAFTTDEAFDVINESMGFQFIDPDRPAQIAEVKRLLKPDGVFLTEEKLRNPDWKTNEAKKDSDYKAKYFSTDELKQKDTRVGFSQSKDESKSVGMVDNMAEQEAFERSLSDNFDYVVQYWDSGNFKGYAAGDDAAKVNAIVKEMGSPASEFSTVDLPREVAFQPNPDIQRVRKEFQDDEGILPPARPITTKFNEEVAKEIADYYDAQPKNTVTPAARASYDAFNQETKRQYQKLIDAGYVLEPWKGEGAPYANSAELHKDLAENKHLSYLPSATAIGEGPAPKDIKNYPPLEDSGVDINGERVPYNDLFRAVHDVFGHGTEGRTFSADGEFQAWQDHARMYSDAAQSALALETLGQNAWFNAGKHLRRPDGSIPHKGDADYIPLRDRDYAPRTIFEFPKELMEKAIGAGMKFSPRKRLANAANEETFDVVHFSSTPGLKTISPKFFGKGKATPTDLRGGPKSYFFVEGSDFGQDSALFEDAGLHPHKATISGDKLYDLRQGKPDDLEWRSTINREEADDNVRAAGYDGLILDTADGRQIVAMFKPVKVTPQAEIGRKTKFQPNTQAAKDLEEDGYRFRLISNETGTIFRVTAGKGGKEIGSISATLNGKDAEIHMVHVDAKHREQGIGEALYRELASELQKRGAEKVGGYTAGPSLGIRKRVFGEVSHPEEGTTKVSSPITPEMKFQPKREDFEDPETLKETLSSPGWAIITGTQEKINGEKVPWDDPRNLAANARLKAELKAKGLEFITVEGKYKGEPQGESYAVLGVSPETAKALGKKYNQESIITNEGLLYGDGSITPAVPEKTIAGPEAENQPFYSVTPDGTAFSIGLDFDKPYKPVGEQQELFGKSESEAQDFARRLRARVTNKREKFPESAPLGYQKDAEGNFKLDRKTGKPVPEKQDYLFSESGLAKKSAKGLRGEDREAAYVKAAGDAMAKEYLQAIKDPEVAAGAKWYSTLRTRLRKLFGEQAQLVCEILAALSARTPVETNYKFGIDALNRFNAGDYDAQLKKYQEGLDKWDAGNISDYVTATGLDNPKRSTFVNWWIDTHDLKPRQTNGKLFAANSKALLRALHGSWEGGKKTRQFSQNMSGEDFGSTIDVWAARTLHRISNEGIKDKWRILPEHENAVQDADFDVAQKVFKYAADKVGVKPDAMQGTLWFREKDLWEKRGWTRGAGAEKSDFSSLISETEKTPSGAYRLKSPQLELLVEPRYK